MHLITLDSTILLNKRLEQAIELYGKSQYNQGVRDVYENFILTMGGTFARREDIIDKERILKLIKKY